MWRQMHAGTLSIMQFIGMLAVAHASETVRVVATVSSVYREGPVVPTMLRSAASFQGFAEVHVHGYNPAHNEPGIVGHSPPRSPMHDAYRWLGDRPHLVPVDVIASGNPFAITDSVKQARWRTSLVLDAWFVLLHAVETTHADIVVWLENDAVVNHATMASAINRFSASGKDGASCYGRAGTPYVGNRSVCMMFRSAAMHKILRHMLGYHMVQPFDWILSDWSRGTWTTYSAVTHGIVGARHMSTLN